MISKLIFHKPYTLFSSYQPPSVFGIVVIPHRALKTQVIHHADIIAAEKRGWAMGVYQQTVSLGWVIGPAFGGFLSDIIGSRMTFLLGAMLVAIGCILVLFLVKEPPRQRN